MGALRPDAQAQGLESHRYPGSDGPRKFKSDQVRNRAGGRSAAERTMIEMAVGSGRVVMMRRHRHRRCCGTQFQQKRRPARRHEADGNVSAKQQHRQQDAGEDVLAPTIGRMFRHTELQRTMPQCRPGFHRQTLYGARAPGALSYVPAGDRQAFLEGSRK